MKELLDNTFQIKKLCIENPHVNFLFNFKRIIQTSDLLILQPVSQPFIKILDILTNSSHSYHFYNFTKKADLQIYNFKIEES